MRWARCLCKEKDCRHYHQFRPLWRRLGSVTSPFVHNGFHRQSLDLLRTQARSKILIAGTADFGLPASVLDACNALAIKVDLTVIDLCSLPLLLTRCWARTVKQAVETLTTDILDYRPGPLFDAVICDLLLSQVTLESRPKLLESLGATLKSGGLLVMVNRLSQPTNGTGSKATSTEQRRFSDNIMQSLRRSPDINLEPGLVRTWARDYRIHRQNYPVASSAEIDDCIDPQGFHLVSNEIKPLSGKQEWRDGHDQTHPSRYIYSVYQKY